MDNTIRMTVGLLVAAGMAAGCNDQSTPTTSSSAPASFSVSASGSRTSVVLDPIGDASWDGNTGPGSAKKVSGWQDIVRSSIIKTGRTFVFEMDLADAVPSNPPVSTLVWLWGLDTDPATFPEGDPFGPNRANLFEFFVDVEWDGTQFTGLVYDRRPLLTGGALLLTPVSFTIEGNQVKLFVDATSLGDPSTLAWASGTLIRQSDGHVGTEGFQKFDYAPDAGLVAWPQ